MNRAKKSILIFVATVFLGFAGSQINAHAQVLAKDKCGPRSKEPCIQIGTFNIEWLGTKMRRNKDVRTEAEVNKIAELLTKTIDLDLAALIEINPNSDQFAWFKSKLNANGYKVFSPETGSQVIAISYDDQNLDLVDGSAKTLPLPTQFNLDGHCNTSRMRRPVAAKFKAGDFEFWFIGVHFKAQPGGYCSDRVRQEQVDLLKPIIDQMMIDDPKTDIVISGDFNATLSDPSLSGLIDESRLRFLSEPKFRNKKSAAVTYLPKTYASVIDHIVISPRRTLEWVPNSTVIFKPEMAGITLSDYRKSYSDHVPIWTSFGTSYKKN